MTLHSYGFSYGPQTKLLQRDLDHKATMEKIDQESATTPPETEDGRKTRERYEEGRWIEKCRQTIEGMRR